MTLKVYMLEQDKEWDGIVRTFENYDIYYLSGYVKAFQINGDGQPVLIYFENKTTRAINVVIKRDIAHYEPFETVLSEGQYFDLVTPYGYGGFIIE
ncbi:MAG: hypothetical protein ACRC5H_10010 [Treponemataceae bacterium]